MDYKLLKTIKDLNIVTESQDTNIISLDELKEIAFGATVTFKGIDWEIVDITLSTSFGNTYQFTLKPIHADGKTIKIGAQAFANGYATTDNAELLDICNRIIKANNTERDNQIKAAELAKQARREQDNKDRMERLKQLQQDKIDKAKTQAEIDGKTRKHNLYDYYKELLAGKQFTKKLQNAKLAKEAEKYDPETYVKVYKETKLKSLYQNQTANNFGSSEDAVNWLTKHWVKITAAGTDEILQQFEDEFPNCDPSCLRVNDLAFGLAVKINCDIDYDDPKDPAPDFLVKMYHQDIRGTEYTCGFSTSKKNVFAVTGYVCHLLRTYPETFWVGRK